MTDKSMERERALQSEIQRLNKIVQVLMDRAERSTSLQDSEFSLFHTAALLEEQVQKRTAELQEALKQNETVTAELRASEERFRGLVSQSLTGIHIVEDGHITYCNKRALEMFGYDEADLIKQPHFLELVAEEDQERVLENFRKRLSGEVMGEAYTLKGKRKDGTLIDVELYSSRMTTYGKLVLIGMFLDITARVRAEQEINRLQEILREQSTHDPLTGLYNRRYLEESFERELALARRHYFPVSIILADIDYFKKVNDRYGHPAGDQVLRVFAQMLLLHVRSSDIFCRYGGEEFLLVLPHMANEFALKRAESLRLAIQAGPVRFGDQEIAVTASFGIATFPKNGVTTEILIAAADRALYAAKAAGRNRVQSVDTVAAIARLNGR